MFSRFFRTKAQNSGQENRHSPSMSELYQFVASEYVTQMRAPYGVSSEELVHAGYSHDISGHSALVTEHIRQSYERFCEHRRQCFLTLSRAAGHALRTNNAPLEGQQEYDHPRAFKNSNLREAESAYLAASVSYATVREALSTLFHIDKNAYDQTHSCLFDEDALKANAQISPVTLQDIVQTPSNLEFWSQRLANTVNRSDQNPSLFFEGGPEVTANIQMYFDELSCVHTNIRDMIISTAERGLRFEPAPDASHRDL